MSRLSRWQFCAWTALLSVVAASAQPAEPSAVPAAPEGMVEQPCPAAVTLPAASRELLVQLFMEPRKLTGADFERLTRDEEFKRFIEANRRAQAQDWPGLCRYRDANQSALAASAPVRAVFMGDSITENWALADPEWFKGGIVNRGISGQTTPQMVLRFRADVVSLKPAVVHILAGTNDIAGNTGPTRAQDFKDNIMSMAELARAHGIHVILGSIPPAAAFNWRPELQPVPRIRELNTWLRDYAARSGFDYIDYYTALAGPAGELRSELGNDGVHPNRAGYRIMRDLAEKHLAPRASGERGGRE
jgi:lysophospholipase L1-like esterase